MRPLPAVVAADLEAAVHQYEQAMTPEALEYLTSRGLTAETVSRFRLGFTGEGPRPGHPPGRIAIPSLAAGNKAVHLSFRAVGADPGPKYLHVSGDSRLFNPRSIVEADDEIHVTEGQIDCIVLAQCGLHAIGVLGAKAWKRHYPRVLAGFSRVYVWGDSDKAGREFTDTVRDGLSHAVCVRIGPEHGGANDVNELFLAGGQAAILEAMNAE